MMICVLQGALGRQLKPPQHLIQTDDGCRAGSLPNVKFASNNSIDLQVTILTIYLLFLLVVFHSEPPRISA